MHVLCMPKGHYCGKGSYGHGEEEKGGSDGEVGATKNDAVSDDGFRFDAKDEFIEENVDVKDDSLGEAESRTIGGNVNLDDNGCECEEEVEEIVNSIQLVKDATLS